jgi:hypothetical protein
VGVEILDARCLIRMVEQAAFGRLVGVKAMAGRSRFHQNGNRSNMSICLATREAQVQRLVLALGVTAMTLCWGSVTRAQTAFYPVELACRPLPSWYPRGWELMIRYPCYYVYAPSYYSPAYYPYPAVYPHQRVSIRATHRVYRRPYLHPGWWW